MRHVSSPLPTEAPCESITSRRSKTLQGRYLHLVRTRCRAATALTSSDDATFHRAFRGSRWERGRKKQRQQRRSGQSGAAQSSRSTTDLSQDFALRPKGEMSSCNQEEKVQLAKHQSAAASFHLLEIRLLLFHLHPPIFLPSVNTDFSPKFLHK